MKKENRIRKNEEFNRIIAKKHSFSNATFIVYSDNRQLDHARIGISVSKKLGDAVTRNKIKRQLRMMLMETVNVNTCPKDLIVIVRNRFKDNSFQDNKSFLEKLIKKAII